MTTTAACSRVSRMSRWIFSEISQLWLHLVHCYHPNSHFPDVSTARFYSSPTAAAWRQFWGSKLVQIARLLDCQELMAEYSLKSNKNRKGRMFSSTVSCAVRSRIKIQRKAVSPAGHGAEDDALCSPRPPRLTFNSGATDILCAAEQIQRKDEVQSLAVSR